MRPKTKAEVAGPSTPARSRAIAKMDDRTNPRNRTGAALGWPNTTALQVAETAERADMGGDCSARRISTGACAIVANCQRG
jgi:hypothetical protein